jgi:hypothetical protein
MTFTARPALLRIRPHHRRGRMISQRQQEMDSTAGDRVEKLSTKDPSLFQQTMV